MKKLPLEAIDACAPRLKAELIEAGVETVVTMGNSATAGLIDRGVTKAGKTKKTWPGITKLRVGPPKRISLTHPLHNMTDVDVNLVATFHPAYCLRSQAMFPLMLGDIAKALTDERPSLWYEPTYFVIDSNEGNQALDLIDSLLELNRDYGVVVDTESGRDKDTSYGRDDGPYGRILCVGVGGLHQDVENDVYIFTDECLADLDVRRALLNLLVECGIIAQNGKYDIGVLMKFLKSEEPFPLLMDCMLSSYSVYEVGGIHSLDYMAQEVLGAPNWKDDVKPYITKEEGYGAIPRDILYRYNAFDVHSTRLLRGYFSSMVDERGLTSINKFLLRVSRMLTLVEARGIGFDTDVAAELIEEYDEQIDRYEQQLPFNPRSPKQVLGWLEDNGIVTESSDEDHVTAILERPKTPPVVREVLSTMLLARGVGKQKSTYVSSPLSKLTTEGKVHTSFLLHGTTTGRLSSRGPNLQNIPRKGSAKRLYVPAKGRKFIQVDYSQAELRVITWLAKEENLRTLFNDPTKDIFIELCIQMVPGFLDMSPEQQKEARTLIKTFAYGVAYGRTAEGIASDPDFKMTVGEAQKQKDLFDARIPAIKAFQKDIIRRVHDGEDLVNPFGRHRRFFLITDANKSSVENEAMAFLPQSTASDICLESACRLSDDGVEIVNLIHDAILAEADESEAEEVAALISSTMIKTAEEMTEGYVNFGADANIGDRWSELH